MNPFFLIIFLSTVPISLAHAEESKVPSLNEYMGEIVDKFDNYLDESADQRRQVDIKRARIVPKGAKPEIIIRRSGIGNSGNPYFSDGILFDGKRIQSNDSLSRAIEVFGHNFRTRKNVHIWDRLGVAILSYLPNHLLDTRTNEIEKLIHNPEARKIKSIIITLNSRSSQELTKPKYPFEGYLELDGAGIDNSTRIWEIRALTDRSDLTGAHPYIICNRERPSCKVDNLGEKRSDDVEFYTDEDQENGKIYAIVFSR